MPRYYGAVSLSGTDQPGGSAPTDRKGRFSFKVCEGSIRLFASGPNGFANISADAGEYDLSHRMHIRVPKYLPDQTVDLLARKLFHAPVGNR